MNENNNNIENNNNNENLNNNQNNNNNQINSSNKNNSTKKTNTENEEKKPEINNIDEKKKQIKEKINKYLTFSKDTKYEETIKTNPDSLFTFINKERIDFWEKNLFSNQKTKKTLQNFDILSTEPNHPNQNIIKNDVNRSRVRESYLIPGFSSILQSFITFYVKSKNIPYKQGLNEIISPFLLIQYKLKEYFPLNKIYLFFEAFIDKFMTNYYTNIENLIPLKESLSLFVILLKYHEPKIFNKLDNLMIEPSMYATNWIMTEMSAKLKIDILYVLWDFIIREKDDPLFFHFVMVALLKFNKEIIINCDDAVLPILITNLNIFEVDDLFTIILIAQDIRNKTPYSFRILANKLEIFKKDSQNLSEKFRLFEPEKITSMPMFPLEIFFYTYKKSEDEILCPDDECKVSKNLEKNVIESEWEDFEDKNKKKKKTKKKDIDIDIEINDDHICEHCDMKIPKKVNYIFLDLRILEFEDEDEKTGFLPNMIMVPQDELKSDDFSEMITERFLEDRGKFHFVLLTSMTNDFSHFENDYYVENISQEEIKMRKFFVQKKIEKELNEELVQKLTLKTQFKIKEYNNLRLTLKNMLKNNFPFVSYVFGGFNSVHKESFKYNIQLLNHEKKDCVYCQKKKKKDEIENSSVSNELWKHKERIKYNDINSFIKDDENYVGICYLIKYKNQFLEDEKIQILFCFLNESLIIKLYKFIKRKKHENKNNNIIIKESNLNILNKYNAIDDEVDLDDKEPELILLDEKHVKQISKISKDKIKKNILIFDFKQIVTFEYKEKKKKKEKIENYFVVLDFLSQRESNKIYLKLKNILKENKKK